ncbi:MAG: VWA domain-containing protein [Treponema sp.]|jgi:Mg-chelatase subunit ChlD|nr:VWA domain-containing protein [Treponema sp.]
MMNHLKNITIIGLFFPLSVFAGANSEAGASSTRGSYISGLGYIIQPNEIRIDSYVSQVDYNYPLPDREPINVITATDYKNDTVYIQIGLKAKKESFASLPPLNIAFVIDKSGSMADSDKMDWVKDSFRVFADQIREQDFISLVAFDTSATVLIPSRRIRNYQDKQEFIRTVNSIQPGGGTNVYDGMSLGYAQVTANFNREYINRVICLTDGEHNSGGKGKQDIINLADRYNNQNINISTIALGASADIPLMIDTAIKGGGSSRFISDHATMVKTFGSELDRLLVPVARMLKMDLTLSNGVVLKETWGYENRVSGNTIHYSLDTIHNGDYETLLAEVQLNPLEPVSMLLGDFTLEYLDLFNVPHRQGPYTIVLEASAIRNNTVINDPRVKESEGYIVLGRGLINLGKQARIINNMQREYNTLRNQRYNSPSLPQNQDGGLLSLNDNIQSPAARLRNQIIREISNAILNINDLSVYLTDIRNTLGGDQYNNELKLLNNYNVSFSASHDNYAAIQND